MSELEISGYVSDSENIGGTMTSSRPDYESFPLQTSDVGKSSVSDWVRSAQAMLQTPQKAFDRQSKTPEDSAKKKRKFQRFECWSCFLTSHLGCTSLSFSLLAWTQNLIMMNEETIFSMDGSWVADLCVSIYIRFYKIFHQNKSK